MYETITFHPVDNKHIDFLIIKTKLMENSWLVTNNNNIVIMLN